MAGRVAALLMVAMATAPAVASAGARVDYKQAFTTSIPGRSTGTDTQLLYKNPHDPKAKPIPVRQEKFTFPTGTKYDESVVPDCTASDIEIRLLGTSACPADSRTGYSQGDTTMAGFSGEDPLDMDAWDDGGVVVVWGRSHQFPAIGGVARGHRAGQSITFDLPRAPGGPPDGESSLRRIHHIFPARTAGGRPFMRTPRTCPRSGVWTFRGRFTFADGVVEHDVYRMRCKRRR